MMYFNTKGFFIVCLFSILFFTTTHAQTPSINLTSNPPIIDGLIDDEWDNHDAEFIAKNNQGTVSSDSDLNGLYKMCWDADFLYLLVVVNDDILNSDNHSSKWEDDGIEVYFDINNDKPNTYGVDDYSYIFRYNDIAVYENTSNNTNNVGYVQTSSIATIVYEMQFPWSTLGVTNLVNDLLIGFDIHINDNDNAGGRDGKLAWSATTDDSWKDPSKFGTIKLLGLPSVGSPAKPSFSHKRGFYSEPFNLTLSSSTEGASIIYSMDGSDPRYSNTALSANSPLSIFIDPNSVENRGGLTPGVVIRACTSKEGLELSEVKTHSYLFIEAVKDQMDPDGIWPNPAKSGGGVNKAQSIDYDMDPDVVYSNQYENDIETAFTQIPSISIVSDNKHFFDKDQGFYMNPVEQEGSWEKPVSVELINPNGSDGFQINAGIRLRGGYSRMPSNPKHSFRLFFRDEYGDSKLKHALFEKEGVDEFDKIDLRTAQNYSWSKEGSAQNNFLKDVSFRDIQGKMGHPYSRSRYYHLYINGVYWGLFMTEERPEARFAESYMGGDKSDYDVIKPERNLRDGDEDLKVVATDGTLDAAQRLWEKTIEGFSSTASYFEVQGMNEDGTRNTAYERLLDVNNMIDYLQIAYYAGSYDAPISGWAVNPTRPNNYFSIYNRNNPDGFKWFVHDFEHSMNSKEGNSINGALEEDWIITRTLANFNDNFYFFNPVRIHLELMANEEYKIKFADRAFKNLTQGGNLSPDTLQAVFNNRKAQFDMAIIAESARWGDAQRNTPRTKKDWLNYINILETDYIPYRSEVVLEQLRNAGAYPTINPPIFQKLGIPLFGVNINTNIGDEIQISNSNGTSGIIYYTTDGTDPRAIGGGINTSAINGDDVVSINISTTTILKARILDGTEWSALKETSLSVNDPLSSLRITEIHYNPMDKDTIDGSDLEFIELKNTGSEAINLTGVQLSDGINFIFGNQYIEPDSFIVLAKNVIAFKNGYGFMPDGQYTGALKNSGEKITLSNAVNTEIINVKYSDDSPWPIAADGLGNSLVSYIHNPEGDANLSTYWKISSLIGGSPGKDDPNAVISTILITELLSHSDYPYNDAIEFFNPNDEAVDISYWLLTDNKDIPKKWQLPSGTIIPAQRYLTVYEGHFEDTTLTFTSGEFGDAFSLSSHGEEVFLISADVDSNFTGYSTGVFFDEIETNVSFGRYRNSVGDIHFIAQKEITLEEENSDPRVGPVVFNKIMYHPNEFNYEFIELKNITENSVAFYAEDNETNTWKITGIDFEFPSNISLESGASLFIIGANISENDFRRKYAIEESTQIFSMLGALNNDGETLALQKPGEEYLQKGETIFEYILIEEISYNDNTPWSLIADGNGSALVRIDETAYGNDVVNWDDGGYLPTALIADFTDNDLDHNIEIGFVEDTIWQAAILSVSLNNQVLDTSNYSISKTGIVFENSVFPNQADYIIQIKATDYYPAIVVQTITGVETPPTLIADDTNNFINEDQTLTYTDDENWRENIFKVQVDGISIAPENYSIVEGEIILNGDLFPVKFTYSISVSSLGYKNTEINQIVMPYMIAPVLLADETDNYFENKIQISFNNDAKWQNEITLITINGILIDATSYKVAEGAIEFNAGMFETTGMFEINVSSNYYLDTKVTQEIIQKVGINNNLANTKFKVYPNPSNGIFRIVTDNDLKISNYKVINLQGQIIQKGMVNETEFNIDLSFNKSELYLLVITHQYGISTTRLLKQ